MTIPDEIQHTCNYFCDRPECVRRQRDELLHLQVYAASYTRDREAEKRRAALRDRLHTLSGVLARVARPGRRAK